jgi:hypothetical protein
MNTSQKRPDRFLAKRLEAFLVDWANTWATYPEVCNEAAEPQISQADAGITRLVHRYPAFLPLPPADPPTGAESQISSRWWDLVARTQVWIRLAWDAPSLRAREWFIFKARDEHYQQTVISPLIEARWRRTSPDKIDEYTPQELAAKQQAPPLTPFEQALYHFHRIADRARHCGNPECPAPYFFASKKGQRYCSPKCAGPSQREQKRRWWRENRAKEGDWQ